jgi:uncharacterized iron-regulated protein
MADKSLLLLSLLVLLQTGCVTGSRTRPPLPPVPEINSSDADGALKRSGIKDLTAFFADPVVQDILGDWTHRKQALLDYGAFVHAESEAPLSAFAEGNDPDSTAQFKGKAALVFHLLRTMMNEEAFSRAIAKITNQQPFGQRSWDDIRMVFEKESNQDLGWFFTQWIGRKGLPGLHVENPGLRRSGSRFEVSFEAVQKNGIYILDLPVTVSFQRGGSTTQRIRIDEERKKVTLTFDDEPLSLVVDQDYDLPRMLTENETPPQLITILGDKHPLLVLPVSQPDIYKDLRELFKKLGAEERKAEGLRDEDLRGSSLALLGSDNPVIGRLFGRMEAGTVDVVVQVKKNPLNHDKVALLVQARSGSTAAAAAQELARYGASSTVRFDRNITAETAVSERGILMELGQEPLVIDLSLLKTMDAVIDGTAGKKIVYVGEYHDRFAHHNVQLQVIKSLHKKDPRLAIGMEMFQRPFQKTLDDYLGGAIDEREFLKRSEYFKRWGFDYNLYKPILDFARAGKIPVVALNLTREIVEKVSKRGMDALSDEEKTSLPHQMDFSDDDYRDRLKQVFGQHKSPDERSFDFFYQAQILWDETMAESIDQYLKQHPDLRMVVLAGGGHIAFESGIPLRAFRRNGYPYVTVLNDADIEPGAANYIVYPRPLDGVIAPRLMVSLREQGSRLSIVDFQEGSVAKQAGLRAGDAIISVGGSAINSVEDLKLLLFYKKKGDALAVKVMRKRFLFGDKEMEFTVTL